MSVGTFGIRWALPTLVFLSCFLLMAPAWSHEDMQFATGLSSGFLHPISGPDHLVAMVAVGLWGAFLGLPAIWLLPIIFPLIMMIGGVMGVLGVGIPAVELGIATSAIVLGLAVAFALKPPLWLAGALVGLFAIFHGYAHGTTLLRAADPLGYSLGFVIATGSLHLAGVAFGLLVKWPLGRLAVRALGGGVAAVGAVFLAG